MEMNLPNKLTILRIALVPICLVLTALKLYLPAAAVFGLACITDTLDGRIARKRNLVTVFGKFADPIADKVLTLTTMILLASMGRMGVWLPVLVSVRELLVDGLRLVAVQQGTVVPAAMSGKIKTILQMIAILACFLTEGVLPLILCLLAAAATVWSGVEYFVNLWDVFTHEKR